MVAVTEEQFRIYRKCMVDPYFFSQFVYIIHPVQGKIIFNLYEYQRAVLWEFLNKRFNIILKFRQAGLTELIAMYCLWLAMYHDNKNIQIISIKDRVAKKVLKRIKYMYKNLPEFLKTPVTTTRGREIGTQTELEFMNGSSITSVPTTEEAGRSEAVSLLVIDEAAIVRWANQIWAAAFPTLSTGGSAILNSCVVGSTKIITKTGELKIKTLCPPNKGVLNISHLGIEVLSHTGKWRKVTHSVNKGKLETWKIVDDDGNVLKCTPAHKLYTTQGWKPVSEIIDKNLTIIQFETGISKLEEPPVTKKPSIEEFKEIPGYPDYKLSNYGRLFTKLRGKDEWVEKGSNINKAGYHRIKLWRGGENKNFTLAKLVFELFNGPIPDGYVVDHIDCNPDHNWSTNLQAITPSENAKRACQYSYGLRVSNNIGKGFPNLMLVARIKELYLQYSDSGNSKSSIYDFIVNQVNHEFVSNINRDYVKRTCTGERVSSVKVSKIRLVKKFKATIYDITVDQDESYICNSLYINHNTPYGVGGFYHKQWVDAKAGVSFFNPIRLYWQMHPDRDQAWYDVQRQTLGPRRTAQEVDGDFLTSGNTVFDLNDIRAIENTLLTDDEYHDIQENGHFYIKRKPKLNEQCTIGADVAIGRSNDNSAFSIMNRAGEELGFYKGKMAPGQFSKLLMRSGKMFNRAMIAPESNDIGLAVTTMIQNAGYPNLYYSKQLLKKKGKTKPVESDVPGWYTTTSTRPIIIDELEEDIRNDRVDICNKFFVDEAYTFIYDSRNRPIAMGKDRDNSDDIYSDGEQYTDDSVMAEAITNFVRKGKKFITTNPI